MPKKRGKRKVRTSTTNDRFYCNNEKLVLENEKKKNLLLPHTGQIWVCRFPGYFLKWKGFYSKITEIDHFWRFWGDFEGKNSYILEEKFQFKNFCMIQNGKYRPIFSQCVPIEVEEKRSLWWWSCSFTT